MNYGNVNVKNEDVATFMNEVKPQSANADMSDKNWVSFSFETYDDYTRAQKWVFAHYDFEISDAGKVIGNVYYDKGARYCYHCDVDGHEEQGFSTPFKAEDALLEYFYNL